MVMRVKEYEQKINDNILRIYSNSLDYYNRNIDYALDAINSGKLSAEEEISYLKYIDYLKNKRSILLKTIKVLRERAEKGSVLEYDQNSEHQIVGLDNVSFYKNRALQENISLSLDEDLFNLATLDFALPSIGNNLARRRLEKSVNSKQRSLEMLQTMNGNFLISRAIEEGCLNFGLTHQEFSEDNVYVDNLPYQIGDTLKLLEISPEAEVLDRAYKKE